MQTEPSTAPYGRRTMMFCLIDSDGRTKAHPKTPKKAIAIRDILDVRASNPSIWPSSKANRDFLNPHVGIRAPDADNQCLPVFRFETGKASAISAFLKLSIRFGEIFAVFRHRAE